MAMSGNDASSIANFNKRSYPSSKEILELLEAGALIAIIWMSPYGGAELVKQLTFKILDKVWGKYDQARLRQNLKRLVDRRLLDIKQEGKETIVVVSEKGKKLLLRYNLKEIRLNKPKVWDHKWRIVIFDIGEDKKILRDRLRDTIKSLGLYPLQKSVFVTPYLCRKEIAFLRQYYGIGDEVSCFTAVDLEEEEFLKKKFNLV